MREHPATVLLVQHAAIAKMTDELDGEERAAFRSRVDRGGQPGGETMVRKFQRQITLHVLRRQKRERELAACAARLQLQPHPQQRMRGKQ